MEGCGLSRKTIIDELRAFNLGGEGKHLYKPATVMPILDNLNKAKAQRQARCKIKKGAICAFNYFVFKYLK